MDKEQIFNRLRKQSPASLLGVLLVAYDEMNEQQRLKVFAPFAPRSKPSKPSKEDGRKLLKEIREFRQQSFDGVFYAPFDINSKNWTHIPEETEEWFDRIGALLEASVKLTEQGEHATAVECFTILYELIEAMSNGEDIVFADEYGTWMIHDDEKKRVKAYLTSLAAVSSAESFAAAAAPLIKHDSYYSFSAKAYAAARRVANKEQRVRLQEEIERQNIRLPDK
ncbi:MAG: hypothetical protein ACREEM_24035 [Blastocatellia bacterium]